MRPSWSTSAAWPTVTGGIEPSCSGSPSSPRRPPPVRPPPASGCSSASVWCRPPVPRCSRPPPSGWCSPPPSPNAGPAPCGPGRPSVGMSAAIGPVVGGLLVALSWRWVFLVNVPVGIVTLIVGWRRLPHVPGPRQRATRSAGGAARDRGCRRPHLRAGQGQRLGMGLPVHHRDARRVGRPDRLVRAALPAEPEPAHPPVAVPVTPASPGRRWWPSSSPPPSEPCCCRSCCGSRASGDGRRCAAGLAIAPGPLMVPLVSFLVAGRLIARYGPALVIALGSLAFGVGISWWALADHRRTQLPLGRAGRDDPHRCRGGPHPPDHDGHRRVVASPAVVRHRIRASST